MYCYYIDGVIRLPTSRAEDSRTEPRRHLSQVERSEQMRERLLDAAIEVIRKRGYLGFTTVEAAKVAGVTRGAPLHYYKSTEAYLLAALEHLFESAQGRSRQSAAESLTSLSSVDEVLDALLADARASYFHNDFFAGLDVMIGAMRDSDTRGLLHEIDTRLRHPVEDMWADHLTALGVPWDVAETVVWMAYSAVRGAAIRSLVTDDPDRIDAMLDKSLALLRTTVKDSLQE